MTLLAAIDVGSNAMRLAVGRVEPGSVIQTVANVREPVRLGKDVFSKGFLSRPTIQRAVSAFQNFKATIDRLGVDIVSAVATSAMREAENGDELIEAVEQETGIRIRVIGGHEEAGLVFLAVSNAIDLGSKRDILVDIGGGSADIALVRAGRVFATNSLKVGTVRMLEMLNADPSGESLADLVEHSVHGLVPWIHGEMGTEPPDLFVGTGGNVEALGELGEKLFGTPKHSLSRRAMEAIIKTLQSMDVEERRSRFGFRQDRADVILPAALVLHRLMVEADARKIDIPGVGLKDGLLLHLAQEIDRHDTSINSEMENEIQRIQRKYAVDEERSTETRQFAAQIFSGTRAIHGLDGRSELLLDIAAALYDVGSYIATEDRHKHSHYILRSESIEGLSDEERLVVANVARYHNKATPSLEHEAYASLPSRARAVVQKLTAILRLAISLDTNFSGKVSRIDTEIAGKNYLVRVTGDEDYMMEKWVLVQKAAMFSDTFGLKVIVEQRRN